MTRSILLVFNQEQIEKDRSCNYWKTQQFEPKTEGRNSTF